MTAKALTTGEIKLIRNAISGLKGIIEKTRPIIKYKGLPGGWGTPKINDVAINSPESQYGTVSAMVNRYTIKEMPSANPAKIRFKRI
tara:strand:- start:828 stop:1088 length:261 start_codon:yes stop_codon:yes gene_type:complete